MPKNELRGASGKALLTAVWIAAQSAAADLPRLSPFEAVRWNDPAVEVMVKGAWYELLDFDGLPSADLLDFCRRTYGARWQKRFEEDLVEVLVALGRPVFREVALKLRDLRTGGEVLLERVPMTEENRRALWRAAQEREARERAGPRADGRDPPRVEREHARAVPRELSFLSKRIEGGALPGVLSRDDAEADLDELEWHLVNGFAYLELRGADYRAALDAVRSGLGNSISRAAFAVQLLKVLALLGDGHTRLREDPERILPGGYLPFLVEEAAEGLVAFRSDRSGFLAAGHPLLAGLDGRQVAEWIGAAERISTGSGQLRRWHAVRNLRFAGSLRSELGIAPADSLRVELRSPDGRSSKTLTLPLAGDRPIYGTWPRRESGLLAGNVGYLRIPAMEGDPDFVRGIVEGLERYRAARGLILDVRGNGGGSRDVTREIVPFFLTPGAPPRVANVAALRLPRRDPAAPEGYLEDRGLYPLTAGVWSGEDRVFLEKFARAFRPEWNPPAEKFSDWHFLLLRPRADRPRLDRPVVVLQDGGCFSATEVFLGALKGLDRVTLLGTTSGGGSGRPRDLELARSRLRLQVSSMASFRPDGKLYDGRGVEPDVVVKPKAADFIGRTDTVLEGALKRLR